MEFRKMRRFRQQLTKEECETILTAATAGTLALLGERFNPSDTVGLQKEMDKFFSHMLILRMDVEHLTGKEAIEHTKGRIGGVE